MDKILNKRDKWFFANRYYVAIIERGLFRIDLSNQSCKSGSKKSRPFLQQAAFMIAKIEITPTG